MILISNDLVPNDLLPVAAPGLRQWGLAGGLRSHGLDVELVVPRHTADRHWGGMPAPLQGEALVLDTRSMADLVRSRAPATVVMTNSNQYEVLRGVPGAFYVFDFFAPKVLEILGSPEEHVDASAVQQLRREKIAALAGADAIIVNGHKKVPYALAWLLQTDRDPTSVPIVQTPMCVPLSRCEPVPSEDPPRVGIAGYLQAWSRPSQWLEIVHESAVAGDIELHVLLPSHWGGRNVDAPPMLRRLTASEHVVHHEPKTYADFVEFLCGLDLVLDLFDWSLEREYAMVTRTVVALAAGRPVIHPPYTEVSDSIAEFQAGWLVDTRDNDLEATLTKIFADPDEIVRRTYNAQELASARLDPPVAVRRLADLIESWS